MKISFYIYSLASGGAERVVTTLANHWVAAGHEVMIVTLAGVGLDFYRIDPRIQRVALDLELVRGNALFRLLDNITRISRLRATLKHFRPRLAIAMMDASNVTMALAGLGLRGMTRVGSERVYPDYTDSGRAWRFLRRWTYALLDGVVAQSEENAVWLRRNTFVRRTWIIPNPIVLPLNAGPPYVSPQKSRKRLRRILAVGRLVPQKGFDLLIEAFAGVADRFPDWELIIIGDGPERQHLASLAAQRPCADRVLLAGAVGNVGDWYADADLFVLPSRFEGFPNALLEAMAHGLAVIAADCRTGPRTLVSDGVDGLLVQPGEAASLALAMAHLMANDELRRAFAMRARSARDRFSVQSVAKLWTDLLEHPSA